MRVIIMRLFLFRTEVKMVKIICHVILLLSIVLQSTAYETVNSTQIKIENNSAQRDYQEQEEGKVLPFRYSEGIIRSRRMGRFCHSGTVRGLSGAGGGEGSAIQVQ